MVIENDDESLESFMLEFEREDDDDRNTTQDVKRFKMDFMKQLEKEEMRSLIQDLESQVDTAKNSKWVIDLEGWADQIINDEGIGSKQWPRLTENMYLGDIGNRPLLGKYIQQVFQSSQDSSMTEGSKFSPPSFSPTRKRATKRKLPNEGVEANTVRSVSPATVAHFPVVKIMVIGIPRFCMCASL